MGTGALGADVPLGSADPACRWGPRFPLSLRAVGIGAIGSDVPKLTTIEACDQAFPLALGFAFAQGVQLEVRRLPRDICEGNVLRNWAPQRIAPGWSNLSDIHGITTGLAMLFGPSALLCKLTNAIAQVLKHVLADSISEFGLRLTLKHFELFESA